MDFPGRTLISIGTAGLLSWWDWHVGLESVDGTTQFIAPFEVLPGSHTLVVDAVQGAEGGIVVGWVPIPTGVAGIWSCRGSISFNIQPGSYEIAFNYDKENPQLRLEEESSEDVIATAPCGHIPVSGTTETLINNPLDPANQ